MTSTSSHMAPISIPAIPLSSGAKNIPILGLGTATVPPVEADIVIQAVLEAIKLGIRHFDTAAAYLSEPPLGDAIAKALALGLLKSRNEVFITTKLWCSDAHADRVIPALQQSLRNLKLEYLDLYLIHTPASLTPGTYRPQAQHLLPLDIKAVWTAMEECQRLDLTKSIGVSNFSCKKLGHLLEFAKIPPSINQVEMNPGWQQKKLLEFSKANGVLLSVYSPLGGIGNRWGSSNVMENKVLKEIADAKGKSVAQICMRWTYEQGVVVIFKSYKKERLKENLSIFDWQLTEEETEKIRNIPQRKSLRGEEFCTGKEFCSENGAIKTIEELWDGEIDI